MAKDRLKKELEKYGKRKSPESELRETRAKTIEDFGYGESDRGGLAKDYEAYKMERDALGSEERKEARGAKKRARMLSAIGKAVGAIGKIGAAKAGGLVSGDLVPDLDYGRGELDAIEEKYDTKRLSLSERGRELAKREKELDVADIEGKKSAVAKRKAAILEKQKEVDEKQQRAAERKAEKKAKAEEERIKKRLAKEDKVTKKEAFKYTKAADKITEDFIEEAIDGLDDDSADEASIVEAMEKLNVDPELIEEFESIPSNMLGFGEDEEAQKAKLLDLRQRLLLNITRNRIKKDVELGAPVNPRIIEAFGLTEEGKDVKVEESEPKAEAKVEPTGEPAKIRYELTLPNGAKQIISKTPEEAEDIRDNAESKGMSIKLKRLK